LGLNRGLRREAFLSEPLQSREMPGYRAHLMGGVSLYLAAIILILLLSGEPGASLPEFLESILSQVIPRDLKTSALSIIFLLFGSLAPDLDSRSSVIRRIVTSLSVLTLLAVMVPPLLGLRVLSLDEGFLTLTVLILTLALIPRLFHHRGAWHWFLGLLVGAWAISLLSSIYGVPLVPLMTAYALGYLSHLMLDAL